MSRRRLSLICLLCLGLSVPLAAIVIRHDKADADYRASAGEFPSLVLVNRPGAHGTLIAPTWVLTAAHVAHPLRPGHRVTVAGRDVTVREVRLHPGWRKPQTNIVDDIALVRLAEPLVGVAPSPIYRRTDEAGRVAIFAGRGGTGNGRDGLAPFTGPYEPLRKATNQVDRVSDRWIVFDFDGPGSGTALEGISGPGDSGGPAFLDVEGTRYLAGVSSWQDSRAQGRGGVYGVLEYYARVSSYARWIDEVAGAAYGPEPALFLPDLGSSAATIEHGATATPDGRELWFTRATGIWGEPVTRQTINVAHRLDGGSVARPAPAPFSGVHLDDDPLPSPDGRWIYFVSDRPAPGKVGEGADLWRVRRRERGWGSPEHLAAVSSPGYDSSPVVTADGDLWFSSARDGGLGSGDLWRARSDGAGGFAVSENLGAPLNSPNGEWNLLVAPDGAWVMFEASGRPENLSRPGDLYLSRRTPAGWSAPVNLRCLNSPGGDLLPRFGFDGRLLFASSRALDGTHTDIYMTDLRAVLEDCTPG